MQKEITGENLIQRNNNIPVLVNNRKIAIKDSDTAEMLVETFIKVHSNKNISENMRKYREQKVRPIALTSNLCKIMERMIMNRLTYVIESRDIFSACQSGFRKGRNMMDSILCLEAEIRKAKVNKLVLVRVFFDVEKAYGMLWKEGLLMKLESLRIDGKLYNWILSFLFGRTIQVIVGTAFSQILPIENGTPQGSASSPILFNLMINDIYHNVDTGIGRSLYADDEKGGEMFYLLKIKCKKQ